MLEDSKDQKLTDSSKQLIQKVSIFYIQSTNFFVFIFDFLFERTRPIPITCFNFQAIKLNEDTSPKFLQCTDTLSREACKKLAVPRYSINNFFHIR